MELSIIITLCGLILLSYIFDITAPKTRIPSVILLLILGFFVKKGFLFFKKLGYISAELPDLQPVLPILGTVGLILIVLEGTLDLEFNRSKLLAINKSFWMAILSLIFLAGGYAWVLNAYWAVDWRTGLLNALPLFIISSAIAIPSVKHLGKKSQELVVYESSLSDVMGVTFFNFFLLHTTIDARAFLDFGIELSLMILISFVATVGLSFLLSKSKHHIKFIPVILLILMIYALSKVYHLPALIFIMVFGLFLGNLDELKKIKWLEWLQPDALEREVIRFKEITTETTFLVRSLFFIMFGFLIKFDALIQPEPFYWASGIMGAIILFRLLQLLILGLPVFPLLFIAPRGLITILLFISVVQSGNAIPQLTETVILQLILLSSGFMMLGLFFAKPQTKKQLENKSENSSLMQ